MSDEGLPASNPPLRLDPEPLTLEVLPISPEVREQIKTVSVAINLSSITQTEIEEVETRLKELLRKKTEIDLAQQFLTSEQLVKHLDLGLGCDEGRPVAALLLYRACLQWKFLGDPAASAFPGLNASPGPERPILTAFTKALLTKVDTLAAALNGQEGGFELSETESSSFSKSNTQHVDVVYDEAAYWLSTLIHLLALTNRHVTALTSGERASFAGAASAKAAADAAAASVVASRPASLLLRTFRPSALVARGQKQQQQQAPVADITTLAETGSAAIPAASETSARPSTATSLPVSTSPSSSVAPADGPDGAFPFEDVRGGGERVAPLVDLQRRVSTQFTALKTLFQTKIHKGSADDKGKTGKSAGAGARAGEELGDEASLVPADEDGGVTSSAAEATSEISEKDRFRAWLKNGKQQVAACKEAESSATLPIVEPHELSAVASEDAADKSLFHILLSEEPVVEEEVADAAVAIVPEHIDPPFYSDAVAGSAISSDVVVPAESDVVLEVIPEPASETGFLNSDPETALTAAAAASSPVEVSSGGDSAGSTTATAEIDSPVASGEDAVSRTQASAVAESIVSAEGFASNRFELTLDSGVGPSTSVSLPTSEGGAAPAATALAVADPVDVFLKSAALAFRMDLDLLTQRVYGIVRDTMKRRLSVLLLSCIQAGVENNQPASSTSGDVTASGAEEPAQAEPGAAPTDEDVPPSAGDTFTISAEEAALGPWQHLAAAMDQLLAALRAAAVPRIIIKCLFKQVLNFSNVQLFNQLLLRPECCSAGNARNMAAGIAVIDQWLAAAAGGELASLGVYLGHLRQAVKFLAHRPKRQLQLRDLEHMCPDLQPQQLYKICTAFWDDQPPKQLPIPAAAVATAETRTAIVETSVANATTADEVDAVELSELPVIESPQVASAATTGATDGDVAVEDVSKAISPRSNASGTGGAGDLFQASLAPAIPSAVAADTEASAPSGGVISQRIDQFKMFIKRGRKGDKSPPSSPPEAPRASRPVEQELSVAVPVAFPSELAGEAEIAIPTPEAEDLKTEESLSEEVQVEAKDPVDEKSAPPAGDGDAKGEREEEVQAALEETVDEEVKTTAPPLEAKGPGPVAEQTEIEEQVEGTEGHGDSAADPTAREVSVEEVSAARSHSATALNSLSAAADAAVGGVMDLVSGEVLEALKAQCVSGGHPQGGTSAGTGSTVSSAFSTFAEAIQGAFSGAATVLTGGPRSAGSSSSAIPAVKDAAVGAAGAGNLAPSFLLDADSKANVIASDSPCYVWAPGAAAGDAGVPVPVLTWVSVVAVPPVNGVYHYVEPDLLMLVDGLHLSAPLQVPPSLVSEDFPVAALAFLAETAPSARVAPVAFW